MMTIKHLIAGAVVTVAVTSALVLGSAVGAQAQVFPNPMPLGPGPVTTPIYGPPFKPSVPPQYAHVLDCSAVFSTYANNALAGEGYVLTTDHAIYATADAQLITMLNAGTSNSCRWVQRKTGAIVDTTTAIRVNDGAFAAQLRSTGFAEPGPVQGFHRTDSDGRTETIDVAGGQGGVDLITFDWNRTDLTFLFQDINGTFWAANH